MIIEIISNLLEIHLIISGNKYSMTDRFMEARPLKDRGLTKEEKEQAEKDRKKKYNLPDNPLDDFHERN